MIKYIVLGFLAILVLGYFGYDLRAIVESPTVQSNLTYVTGGIKFVWNEYLSQPILYFWNNIFLNILWGSFMHNLGQINAGAPTELEAVGQRLLNMGDQPYQPLGQ
jgi:hypothetical protein